MTPASAIKQILEIIDGLKRKYAHKEFTMDGRLLGDLGEILASENYHIRLNPGLTRHHDAITDDNTNRNVQIKATMKDGLTFPCDHIPDYYLGIKLHGNGEVEEVFNGPGYIVAEIVKNRKKTKTNYHYISLSALILASKKVEDRDRIGRRT